MPKAKKTVQEVKQDAEKVVEEVKQEADKAVDEVKAVAEEGKAEVKKAAKAAKTKAVKTTAKAKAAAKKVVTGESAPVVYVQYQGDEEKVEDLVAAATAAFRAEHSHTKVTGLKLYIKPEERAAYYVVNDKFAGRVDF